jgi:hypothetical protein
VKAPRIRTIKPELWRDQDLQYLPIPARLLFIGLISNADDEGRLEGNPGLIRSIIFPCDVRVTSKHVDGWLALLDGAGFICRYNANDRPYIALTSWKTHQKIDRATSSHLPEPSPNGRVRIGE